MPTIKVMGIDETSKSVIAKIWDPTLSKSIDDYPSVAVDMSRINFNEDITLQLNQLLSGHLHQLKASESPVHQSNIDKINKLIGTEINHPEYFPEPEGQDLESLMSLQEDHKKEWEFETN